MALGRGAPSVTVTKALHCLRFTFVGGALLYIINSYGALLSRFNFELRFVVLQFSRSL